MALSTAQSMQLGKPLPVAGNDAKLHQTAQDFEAVFLSQVFQSMTAGLEADPVFGGGNAETVIRSMLYDQYGKEMAKSGGVGIASSVYREVLRMQEARQ
ncbi:MAG TPA: rod-binding protein [Candidatus Cybelea sp.]|nr:rod-binding protein [Candidatus Cybelea sp.]